MKLQRINYKHLNARQKESYNFQKLFAVLADYGYKTLWCTADWNGVDFFAYHIDGHVLSVQLKGRLTFAQKYRGKGLYIAFADNGVWYLYPHDELLKEALKDIESTEAWQQTAIYHYPTVSTRWQDLLKPYSIRA